MGVARRKGRIRILQWLHRERIGGDVMISRTWTLRERNTGWFEKLQRGFLCPVCDGPVPAPMPLGRENKNAWDCQQCGPYRTTGQAEASLRSMVEADAGIRTRLARWIAEQRLCPEITVETIDRIR